MGDTPLYIKSIDIEGLFGEKDLHWDLRQDVNILGGQNGSGKSTILRALYLLLKGGEALDQHKCGKLMESMTVVLTNGNVHKWVKGNAYVDQELASPARPVVEYVSTFEPMMMDMVSMKQNTEYEVGEQSTYLDALVSYEKNRRNEWFSEVMSSIPQDSQYVLVTNKEGSAMSAYSDMFKTMAEFTKQYAPLQKGKLTFKKHDAEIDRASLSSGEKMLLYILLKVTNMQKQPGILIMDEPDLAMHVEWQKVLLKSLRELNPNMQLVVCTHAPRMITGWQECVKEVGQLTTNRAHHE